MERHKFIPVIRLPHRRDFSSIMSKYTKAYKVSDDPIWKQVPVLGVCSLDTIEISHWDGKWVRETYVHKTYPHRVNNNDPDTSELVVTTLENNRVESFKVSTYKSPVFTDEFDSSVHITADKRRANQLFILLLKQFLCEGDHVFVLDSPAGHTVKMMHGIVQPEQLHVANPDASVPSHLYKLAQWHCATALEFVRDYNKNVPMHYWLDYCCTFDGCATQTLPQLDIEAIFCRGDLPRYNGVICLTFSLRGYKASDLAVAVQRFMRNTGKRYGYKIHMAGSVFFYKRIAFFRFITVQL